MRRRSCAIAFAVLLLVQVPMVADGTPSPSAPHIDPGVWRLFATLLADPSVPSPPRNALDLLGADAAVATDGDPWAALLPTLHPDDRAAIAAFARTDPALSAVIGSLSSEVSRASRIRDEVFDAVEDSEWPFLAEGILALTSGRPLTDRQRWAIDQVDIDQLARSATRLLRAVEDTRMQLEGALRSDERLDSIVPRDWRLTETDPVRILNGIAAGAPPVSPVPLDVALAALARLGGVTLSEVHAQRVPADLRAPLSATLMALLITQATPTDGSSRSAAATIAAALPALERAAVNLSLTGVLDDARHPLWSGGADITSSRILGVIAPTGPPPRAVGLVDGVAALHASLDVPLSDDMRARLARMSGDIGSARADAIGALAFAQAGHESLLRSNTSWSTTIATFSTEAAALLDSDAPLTREQRALLHAYTAAVASQREAVGVTAGGVLAAADALTSLGTMRASASTVQGGVLLDTGLFVLMGEDDTVLTAEAVRSRPVLLVDLGGNDTYRLQLAGVNASASTFGVTTRGDGSRTAIAVDLGGDDVYTPDAPFALGGAIGAPGEPALAALFDASGNDTYAVPNGGLAWGSDGIGVIVDARGDDTYDTLGAIGFARTTDIGSLAAGILLDHGGNDRYAAPAGFAVASGQGVHAVAVFDLQGDDAYDAECPTSPAAPCFGIPRPPNHDVTSCNDQGTISLPCLVTPITQPAKGVMIFIDNGGVNTYPREDDPQQTTNVTAGRIVLVRDGQLTPADRDGDLFPDLLEDPLGYGDDPAAPPPRVDDSDGDGYPDVLEALLGTDPQDAHDRPVRPPHDGGEVPAFVEIDPEAMPILAPDARNLLIDIPGILALGLPGRTAYARHYLLTIDLGLEDSDDYRNATAAPGVSIDIGGDDRYAPQDRRSAHGGVAASFVTAPLGLLLDLAGDDVYDIESTGLAYASVGVAALIDVDGDDIYRAIEGRAMAYAAGGVAVFADLEGADQYLGPSQGVSDLGTAIFLDVQGIDVYDRGPMRSDEPYVQGEASSGMAAFVDMGGVDRYQIRDASGVTHDISDRKNGRMRATPIDAPGGAAIFLDTGGPTENADGDLAPDAAEVAVGTDPHDASEAPVRGSLDDDIVLKLPRPGIVVGGRGVTTHASDSLLVVDLGGNDLYLDGAGASSPRFPVSVALDLGGGHDIYRARTTTNLSEMLSSMGGGATTDGSYGAAQGAGILGIGLLMDDGGRNTFDAAFSAVGCTGCSPPTVIGASQGAGALGVGILVSKGGPDVFSLTTNANASLGSPISRTFGQGAAAVGIGVLASESATSDDSYVLRANALASSALRATTGQGYGMRGVGVLLDGGGNNTLVASELAQAATEFSGGGHSGTASVPFAYPLVSTKSGMGLLLLPGVGDDIITAETAAQAYAAAGTLAVLHDAEGHDVRILTGTSAGMAGGQAVAEPGGIAVMLDGRGNDVYVARGARAQATSTHGVAILADLGGADRYEATTSAQGFYDASRYRVASQGSIEFNTNTPGFAAFLDRTGNDVYALSGLTPRGQGSYALPTVPPQALTQPETPTSGVALFVDLGGDDVYTARAGGQTAAAAAGVPSKRPADGNDWVWTVPAPAPHRIGAFGIDDRRGPGAFANIANALNIAVGARLGIERADGEPLDTTLQGALRLKAWMGAATGGPIQPAGAAIDRAEFFLGTMSLGQGSPSADGAYDMEWGTGAVDEEGIPRYPDGAHDVRVDIHPRYGAPDADGRRVAAEGEPVSKSLPVIIDNPPLGRTPTLDRYVSSSSPLELPLRVDRDVARGITPAAQPLPHLRPGPDEWDVVVFEDTYGTMASEVACTVAACLTPVQFAVGDGKVYAFWEAPQDDEDVVAYRLVRTSGSEEVVVGVIDARGPGRIVDANPGDAPTYRFDTIRMHVGKASVASSSFSIVMSGAPGPATGLRASGAEGGTRLAWTPSPTATSLLIERGETPATLGYLDEVAGVSEFFDPAPADTPLFYRITPKNADGEGVPSPVVGATASPGHRVTMTIEGATSTIDIVRDAELGGAQTVTIPFDPRGLPDGEYAVVTTFLDGAGRDVSASRHVFLDHTAPHTSLEIPDVVGAPYIAANGFRVPFVVTEDGSGLVETWLFARFAGEPEWRSFGPYLENESVMTLPVPDDASVVDLIPVSIDRAGNAEGVERVLPWRATPEDAFRQALASGQVRSVLVDVSPPTGERGTLAEVIRLGAILEVRTQIQESGSGLASVVGHIGPDDVPMVAEDTGAFGGTWKASKNGTFPITVEARDHAGNVAHIPLGTVIVDDTPPEILHAEVAYAGGHVYGRAGSGATLVVTARDGVTLPGRLDITADLSNVSTRNATRLRWDGDGLTYRSPEFALDRIGSSEAQNLTLAIRDGAGNVRLVTLVVHVNGTRLAVPAPILMHVGAVNATFTWNSTSTARGRILVGEGPQLGAATEYGPFTTTHWVNVTGLKPDTTYFVKSAVITPAGIETVSPLSSFRTGPPIEITWIGEDLVAARDDVTIDASVRGFDGVPTKGRLDVEVTPPRGAVRTLGDLEVIDGMATGRVALTDLRDGEYRLVLRATSVDGSTGTSASVGLIVDRTPPLLRLDPSAVASADDIFRVHVDERGSGIDVARVEWRFDDRSCTPWLESDMLACRVPGTGVDAAEMRITLLVPDNSGNKAVIDTRIPVDAAAPLLTRARLTGVDGDPHLRSGSRAVLDVDVTDLTLATVEADLTALGGPDNATLVRTSGAHYRIEWDVPVGTATEARVLIRATDGMGRVTTALASAPIDASPPRLVTAGIEPLADGRLHVAAVTEEPTRLILRLHVGERTIERESPLGTHHSILVAGLLPDHVATATFQLRDLAGWTTIETLVGSTTSDHEPPSVVPELSAEDLGDGRVILRWKDARDDYSVAGYVVRRISGGDTARLPIVRITTHLDEAPVGKPIQYTVAAVDHGGNEGPSTSVTVLPTSIPRLTAGNVTPPLGGPGLYAFQVRVADAAGTPPNVALRLDGIVHPMKTQAEDCSTGCDFTAILFVDAETLASGPHKYAFTAENHAFAALLPAQGEFVGPVVVSGLPRVDGATIESASRIPSSGVAIGLFLLAFTAISLTRRRWRP